MYNLSTVFFFSFSQAENFETKYICSLLFIYEEKKKLFNVHLEVQDNLDFTNL